MPGARWHPQSHAVAGRFLADASPCKPTRPVAVPERSEKMTEPYYFETTQRTNRRADRSQDRPRPIRDVRRELRAIEIRWREASQIRTMIASLNREIASLDAGIAAELATSRVRDPRHYAYPTTARAMDLRKQNLSATIASLTRRLDLLDNADTSEALIHGLQPA